jgi:hypothetical protein
LKTHSLGERQEEEEEEKKKTHSPQQTQKQNLVSYKK